VTRVCTVCARPDRGSIDGALVASEPYRSVAKRFEASASAVYRHQQDHLPAALSKAKDAQEIANSDDLLQQVKDLQGKAFGILNSAEQAGGLRSGLGAIREARGCMELLAKLVYVLAKDHEEDQRPTGSFVIGKGYIDPPDKVLAPLSEG